MHDFKEVDAMKQQLISEGVCPFKHFSEEKLPLSIGTHHDALSRIYESRYEDATLLFWDGHDLPA